MAVTETYLCLSFQSNGEMGLSPESDKGSPRDHESPEECLTKSGPSRETS